MRVLDFGILSAVCLALLSTTFLSVSVGCLPTSYKPYRVVSHPVTEGLETVSAARIDFTGLHVETTADDVEFIISVAHRISTLDCLPTSKDNTSYFAEFSFMEMNSRRTIEQFFLYSDGEVLIRGDDDGQRVTIDKDLEGRLQWQEDSQGSIRLTVPWELIPHQGKQGILLQVAADNHRVSKLKDDSWGALNKRYGGRFKLDASDGSLAIESNQLLAQGKPLEGALGHISELCRRGTAKRTFDMIPGRGPTVSKRYDDRDLLWAIHAPRAILLKKP